MLHRKFWIGLVLMFLHVNLLGNDTELKTLFESYEVEGTLLIESLDGKERYVYNEQRAKKPLLPASTFKIPHTLIALQEGVVNSHSNIIWDRLERSITAWNQDHNLSSAFQSSCVWCYQSFARLVGLKKYNDYLQKLHYGNEKTGLNVERFWLDGELRISAYEQIAFLKKLYQNDLPFLRAHLDTLKFIMIDEQTPSYTIRAKTGWATPQGEEYHGWYVGYAEGTKGVYFFATNLITPTTNTLPLRKKLSLKALQFKGILE